MSQKPARRASHLPSIAASAVSSDHENSDDSIQKGKKPRQGKMSYAQEDIFISSVLKWFDDVENKATDKSLCQSTKKKATEAWKLIQTEYEKETNVSTFQQIRSKANE